MNTTTRTTAHVLLVETAEGGHVAVRFPSAAAARDWDDAHPDVETVGCMPIVSARKALTQAHAS